MLKIRLARTWRTNRAFFRIVLTEHTKPVKSGYKEVLWWYDPVNHKGEMDIEAMKKYIANGASLSPRVARLAYKETSDKLFQKFYEEKNLIRKKKKEED